MAFSDKMGRQEARMAKTLARERPERGHVLQPVQKRCLACGVFMRIRCENEPTLVTLQARCGSA